MKPNSYKIISDCVSRGIDIGWNKSHKHTHKPSIDLIKSQIENCIIMEICDYFYFDEDKKAIKTKKTINEIGRRL